MIIKILATWVIWQLLMIGLIAGNADANKGSQSFQDYKIDCSSSMYKTSVFIGDVLIPLIQFTDLGIRDCQTN